MPCNKVKHRKGDCVTETAYNLFLYISQSSITEIGIMPHILEGTDSEKLSFLQARVQQDHQTANRIQPSIVITWRNYEALMRLGRQLEIFKSLFQELEAQRNPLVVITPVVNGTVHFLTQLALAPLRTDDLQGSPYEQPGRMVDYLMEYQVEGGFDLARLLDDDYFKAIKLLLITATTFLPPSFSCLLSTRWLLLTWETITMFSVAGWMLMPFWPNWGSPLRSYGSFATAFYI